MGDIFLRFDVEDWLTPAADWALERILEELERVGARANFAVVGLKARALVGRGRGDLLRRMARLGSVGYHSYSHSVHPTLAEDLEPRSRGDAERRFVEREGPGVAALAAAGTPPVFFTQPGANWVPEVLERGPDMGLRAFISEAWNTYLKPSRTVYWYGAQLFWSPPVDMPKGLLFRLPSGSADAVAAVREPFSAGEPAMVVTHPTELITHHFWDQDNFGYGETRLPLTPGPAMAAASWDQKLRGWREYLDGLSALEPRYLTVDDWLSRVRPPGPVVVDRGTLVAGLRRHGLGAIAVGDDWLSAAEVVVAAALLAEGAGGPVSVPRVLAPAGAIEDRDPAAAILEKIARDGRLPEQVGAADSASWAPGFLQQVLGVLPPVHVADYVRPASEQHWDWPIFRAGFTAPRLLQEARRQAWTLKPAVFGPSEGPRSASRS
jgi:hypothetical protein